MDNIIIKKIPKKILIIKPSSLGDIVHSLPFLNALKESFPSSEIHWIAAKGFEGLLENHPMIKRLWIINKDKWKYLGRVKETFKEFVNLFRDLKKESYDIVIDLQGLLRSGLLTYFTSAPLRIGFKEAREGSTFFYTHKVECGKEVHAVDRYMKIAFFIGCEIKDIKFPMPLIRESERIKKIKEELRDYAVIVPGARWKTKRWGLENYSRLISMLDIKSVIVGSKSDEEMAKEIELSSRGRPLSLAGKTDLKELLSIIRGARFMVSNDSGPMHIAAALNIPVVAIFGPTNPVRTGPYGQKNIVLRSGLPCSPCYKRECKTIECMKVITVESVYNAINNLIDLSFKTGL
jgi:heptosyltransferase-1